MGNGGWGVLNLREVIGADNDACNRSSVLNPAHNGWFTALCHHHPYGEPASLWNTTCKTLTLGVNGTKSDSFKSSTVVGRPFGSDVCKDKEEYLC